MSANAKAITGDDLIAAIRRAARQEQFLEVVSAEDARARFHAALDLSPLSSKRVALNDCLTRVLAADIAAPVDVPAFDRANVDGFAIRASDSDGASDSAPRAFALNNEVLACGVAPAIAVQGGTATAIATGGVVPRGADAVVMIENTELGGSADAPAIALMRPAPPGQFIAYAGSDIARGETLLRKGTRLSSREIGMLAACGIAQVDVVRRPRVAVLSTGDELVKPGEPLKPGGVYDSNGAIVAAAVTEAGGEPVAFGAFPDDIAVLQEAMARALSECDMLVLSGGTSKGAGDLSHCIVPQLGKPGILVHGVALKPGKPLCLAAIGNKPLIVLPGFPTSAIFTFHAFAAPVIRALAGLPEEAAKTISASVPARIASERGRKEFVLVSLVERDGGMIAFPSPKGSGAVTAFSQSDGFLEIDALATGMDADTRADVTLIGDSASAPDLVIMGSHCVGLDAVLSTLSDAGFHGRSIAVGSLGGVAAAGRGECDLAPVHLLDPASGQYNVHLLKDGLTLIPGWRRMQGVVFREGDARFANTNARHAVRKLRGDPAVLMVNRNAGAGTRILIDQMLEGARPPGYANQPRSHNAVAAAVAQGRADWGVAIKSVADLYGLGFLPLAPEHYDFLLVEKRRDHPAVQAFLRALKDEATKSRIRSVGMTPADDT